MHHWRALVEVCEARQISPSIVTRKQREHQKLALRNAVIRELHAKRGVTVPLLIELAPLSIRTVQEIVYAFPCRIK